MNEALKDKIRAVMPEYSSKAHMFLNALLGLGVDCQHECGPISITSDGYMMGSYTTSEGETHSGAFLGEAGELRSNLQGLADHLKLNKVERAQINSACALACTDHSGNIHDIKVF